MRIYSIKYLCTALIILITNAISSGIYSQTRIDSLEILGSHRNFNLLSSRLDKQLNTYYLNSGLNYYLKKSEFNLSLSEDFKSSFIKGIERTVRDEHHFNLNFNYNLSEEVKIGLLGSNSILSDNRRLEINNSSISNLIFYSEYNPFKELKFAPFAGYSDNRQIGESDFGFTYGLEAFGDRIDISDFQIKASAKFKNEDISPRKNLVRFLNLKILNFLQRNVNNDFNLRYYQTKKDFYINADSITSAQFNIKNNIQMRTETGYLVQNRFFFEELMEIFVLDASGRVSFREISRALKYKSPDIQSPSIFDTGIDELKIELDATLSYKTRDINSSLRFSINEKDEKYKAIRFEGINEAFFNQRDESERQKNNTSTYATLSFDGDLLISDKDRFSINLYQSKLKYDTPSSLNDDDRDEILSIARIGYHRKLNPLFTAFILAEGSYAHTVYIFASRSSNNNTNRIIRLRTGGEYSGSVLSSYNSFDISANYTVYDFEDITSQLKSFSFRQLSILDSTTLKISYNTSLFIYGYLKLSEQGVFNWGAFSEKPSRALQEIFMEPKFILYKGSSAISFGIRYFGLTTFNFRGKEKITDTKYESIGPLTNLQLRFFKGLLFSVYGYYEFISITNSEPRQQANLNFSVSWNF